MDGEKARMDKETPSQRKKNKPKAKVFISWAGIKSGKKIGAVLKEWIVKILPIEPFFSPEDIAKGAYWVEALRDGLTDAVCGIICITPESCESKWMMFEAGALLMAKAKKHPIMPLFLYPDVNIAGGPLSMFQTTELQKEELLRMLYTINKACKEFNFQSRTNRTIELYFNRNYDSLETQLRKLYEEEAVELPEAEPWLDVYRKISADFEEKLKELEEKKRENEIRLQEVHTLLKEMHPEVMRFKTISDALEEARNGAQSVAETAERDIKPVPPVEKMTNVNLNELTRDAKTVAEIRVKNGAS